MLVKTYHDYLSLRTSKGYSTEEFNKLIDIGKQTKYGWKRKPYLKPIYQLIATTISEKEDLIRVANEKPIILNYDDFMVFRKDMIDSLGEDKFNSIFGIGKQTVYTWKHSMRKVYLTIANMMRYDLQYVLSTYRRLNTTSSISNNKDNTMTIEYVN